jgi:tetratricopeptide (TPR) repeat protein
MMEKEGKLLEMGTLSSSLNDGSSAGSPSSRGWFFAKAWRPRRPLAMGLAILLVVAGSAVGLGWANSWWRGSAQQAAELTVRDHWEQANRASDDGDPGLAKTHLEAILAICPLSPQAQFLMARTCRRTRDDAAWHHLHQAESLGWPQHQIVLEQRLLQAEAGDIWNVEEALLDQLNRLPPEEQVILEGVVRGYLNSARFLDAEELATTWINRFPENWQPYLYRGRAKQALGQWNDAIWDYREVLKIRPDSITARRWYADALLASHDYQNALESYRVYCDMVPDDQESLFAVAQCQFSLGHPEAQAAVEELLARYPQHVDGLILSARISLTEDKPEKALSRLRQAQALGSHDPEFLQVLIQALTLLHRPDDADSMKKQYANVLQKAKQLRELGEKIQAEPDDASLRYQAGKLALELQQEKEASDWFQSVFWIDPDHRPTHLVLADYWSEHGQPQRAAYHHRRAEGKRR